MTRTILHTRFILITSSTAGFMALSGGAERGGGAHGWQREPLRARGAPRCRRGAAAATRGCPGARAPHRGALMPVLGVTTARARRRGALRGAGGGGPGGEPGRSAPPPLAKGRDGPARRRRRQQAGTRRAASRGRRRGARSAGGGARRAGRVRAPPGPAGVAGSAGGDGRGGTVGRRRAPAVGAVALPMNLTTYGSLLLSSWALRPAARRGGAGSRRTLGCFSTARRRCAPGRLFPAPRLWREILFCHMFRFGGFVRVRCPSLCEPPSGPLCVQHYVRRSFTASPCRFFFGFALSQPMAVNIYSRCKP